MLGYVDRGHSEGEEEEPEPELLVLGVQVDVDAEAAVEHQELAHVQGKHLPLVAKHVAPSQKRGSNLTTRAILIQTRLVLLLLLLPNM